MKASTVWRCGQVMVRPSAITDAAESHEQIRFGSGLGAAAIT